MLKDILRWTAIVGIFSIPIALPFIISSSMFFPFITGKNFTFRIIVEIIVAAWVLLALLDARYRPRFSWILGAITFFVVVIGIADFSGVNVFKSFWSNFERMEGYLAILHLFAYFLVASTVLNTEKIWNVFWYSSLGTSVIVAFIGLKPVFDVFPDISFIPRIEANFGNPIYLAVYSLFHAFIALMLMEKWKGVVWHRALLGFVALLHMVVIVLTQTRGTLLGFLGGVLVTTLLIVIFERENKILRYVASGALIVIIAIVGAGFVVKDTEVAKNNQILSRFTQIELSSGTVHARFMNWGMAWQGAKEKPLLGWGQGNYEYVFSKYFDPGMYAEEPWFDRTHNIFFDWLVAGGFLGLIAYLLIPTSLIVHLWVLDPKEKKWPLRKMLSFEAIRNLFKKRDHAFTGTERAVWTGLLAGYMFHNLFVFDNIISYVLFFSVLAYLHFRVTEGNAPLWSEEDVSESTVVSVAVPLVIVITGLVLWYVNIPGIKSSQALIGALMQERGTPSGQIVRQTAEDVLGYYKKAVAYDQLGRQEVREQLVQMASNMRRNENVSQDTKLAFQNLALTEVEREVARNPNSARLRLFSGSLYGSLGQIEKAEAEFKKVVELTPTKQNALFQLGEIYLFQNKNEEALEVFKRAYELEKEYDQAARYYALSLVLSGRDKEAVDFLTERFGTLDVGDDRLFSAWAQAKRFDILVAILEKRVADNPDDIQQRVSLAAAYKELGDINKAVALLTKTKEEKPEYAEQMDNFIKEIRGW